MSWSAADLRLDIVNLEPFSSDNCRWTWKTWLRDLFEFFVIVLPVKTAFLVLLVEVFTGASAEVVWIDVINQIECFNSFFIVKEIFSGALKHHCHPVHQFWRGFEALHLVLAKNKNFNGFSSQNWFLEHFSVHHHFIPVQRWILKPCTIFSSEFTNKIDFQWFILSKPILEHFPVHCHFVPVQYWSSKSCTLFFRHLISFLR